MVKNHQDESVSTSLQFFVRAIFWAAEPFKQVRKLRKKPYKLRSCQRSYQHQPKAGKTLVGLCSVYFPFCGSFATGSQLNTTEHVLHKTLSVQLSH
jgi:hypothetical protein